MEKKLNLDKDLRTILVFALRYALPRHTYSFSMVVPYIIDNIDTFENWEIEGMIRDCELYYPDDDCGGAICDQPAVDRFKASLEKELSERNRG